MIDTYDIQIVTGPGERDFIYKGKSYSLKTLAQELVRDGLTEELAIKLIINKTRQKNENIQQN